MRPGCRNRHVPRAVRGLSLAIPALLASGCASHWAPRTAQPAIALQWPFQPAPAKLTYLRSLTGFAPGGGAGSALKAIVHGSEPRDAHGFGLPVAVATAADGRIAVADTARRCVHLYLPATGRYLRLTGSKTAPIVSPVGVIFDEQSRLYVSDSAGQLLAFGADGALRFTRRQAGDEPLRRPTGLAYSRRARLLYLVDTAASRVHALDTEGRLAFSFGERGERVGGLNFPTHAFWAASGELYVADSLNFRVVSFDERGTPLGSFGRHGDGSGDMALPKGLAVDADGVVYVVDSLFDNVQLFDRHGEFLLTLGKRGADFGEFWLPAGAFIGENAELYVCDAYNRRVQVFRITERYAHEP